MKVVIIVLGGDVLSTRITEAIKWGGVNKSTLATRDPTFFKIQGLWYSSKKLVQVCPDILVMRESIACFAIDCFQTHFTS